MILLAEAVNAYYNCVVAVAIIFLLFCQAVVKDHLSDTDSELKYCFSLFYIEL